MASNMNQIIAVKHLEKSTQRITQKKTGIKLIGCAQRCFNTKFAKAFAKTAPNC